MSQTHIDELIAKFLAGEASEEETALLETWRARNAENSRYIEQFNTIFSSASRAKELQSFDTDAAWLRVKQAIRKDQREIAFPTPAKDRSLYWKVAAGLLLTIMAGVFFMRQPGKETEPVILTAHTDTVADTLPDGSNVFLNRESTIRFAYDDKTHERRVELKGEAFFTINHDETRKFVVDIDGVFIRDIGTAFNVKAPTGSNTIEVVVSEGEVMFYTAEDSGVYLQAGAKGVYDKQLKKFTLEQPDANALSYKTRVFNFNNTDLTQVIRQLNSVYTKQIELSPNLKYCRLTVGFNNESQDEIIAIIAETLGMKAIESNGRILLDGEGCAP